MKRMNKTDRIQVFELIGVLVLLFGTNSLLCAADGRLEQQVDSAWKAIWNNFYSTETCLFYDFLESLEPGKTLDHLPTAEEVRDLNPNPCGYGTAM
ncbi:MAG: hypothetical protein IIY32_08135, partial [Thermoguttaceae bacterium]|nr:hypothetical protein [Thermoguttaceae bacterium]